MKTAKKPSAKKYLPKRQGRNEMLRRKLVENTQKGMDRREAMLAAGYSPTTVHAHARRTLERPLVKSALTEAVERIMAARQKPFDDIVRPFVDALEAPVVVKSATEGIACIARDPDTQEIIPDHSTRMDAAKNLVNLMGGFPKESEIPPPPAKGLTVIISQDGGNVQVNQQPNVVQVDHTKIEPTGEVQGDVMPAVKIEKG